MVNVSAAQIIGGNSSIGREQDDFYRTPAAATMALLRDCMAPHRIWEPCCGDGAISKVLEESGRMVYSADLIDRNYGKIANFLEAKNPEEYALITNPPFNLAHKIIEHAHILGVNWMALLLKQTYWNTANRTGLFDKYRPSEIHALNWRLDFRGLGNPTMDCMWVVWNGESTRTDFHIMRKPK